jgi:hypothetical protein
LAERRTRNAQVSSSILDLGYGEKPLPYRRGFSLEPKAGSEREEFETAKRDSAYYYPFLSAKVAKRPILDLGFIRDKDLH